MSFDFDTLPAFRGKLMKNTALAPYTWFRVGGTADALFLPADTDDLASFLKALPEQVPVTVLGVGSNTIVRDGGIEGVVIRLMGKYWGAVEALNATTLQAGAGALDLSIAKAAAENGTSGLSFLSGIPGTIGGALRTNAGCYGRELRDVLNTLEGVTLRGEPVIYQGELVDHGYPQIGFSYRHTDLPTDLIVTKVTVSGDDIAEPETLRAEIAAHQIAVLRHNRSKKKRAGRPLPIQTRLGRRTRAPVGN